MRRRCFLKSGLVFTGLIWVPKSLGQLQISNPFYVAAIHRAQAAGGGCTTESFAQGTSFENLNDFAFYTWLAVSFTTGGSGFTVCKMQAELGKNGTVAAGTLTPKIYTNSGGSPGTLVGSAGSAVDRTTITMQAFWDFGGISASLSSSTTYWAILQASVVDTDASNRVFWVVDTAGESSTNKGSTDGSSWDTIGPTSTFNFKLFS